MDNVLIKMPDNMRDFLVAIPAAQDYQLQLVLGGQRKERDMNFQVTFRMNERFQYFESILQVVRDKIPNFDYSGYQGLSRGEFDCYIDMDLTRAANLTSCNPMHMAQALGLLIGAGPFRWPVIKPLNLKTPEIMIDILVMKWDFSGESEKFAQCLEERTKLEVIYDDRDLENFPPNQVFEYVNSFKCVIGPMGSATYVTATMKKGLIEIFPNFGDLTLYGNAGIPYYQQVIGMPSMEVMWRLWEERWREFQECLSVTNKQSPSIMMEPPVSTVENAAEKS